MRPAGCWELRTGLALLHSTWRPGVEAEKVLESHGGCGEGLDGNPWAPIFLAGLLGSDCNPGAVLDSSGPATSKQMSSLHLQAWAQVANRC